MLLLEFLQTPLLNPDELAVINTLLNKPHTAVFFSSQVIMSKPEVWGMGYAG